MDPTPDDSFILHIPLQNILDYLRRVAGWTGLRQDPAKLLEAVRASDTDWHRLFRFGLQVPLHLNLGIPGLETPEHPVEENVEVLYVALLLNAPTLPVILSGELELARRHGLVDENALSKLRNTIRDSS